MILFIQHNGGSCMCLNKTTRVHVVIYTTIHDVRLRLISIAMLATSLRKQLFTRCYSTGTLANRDKTKQILHRSSIYHRQHHQSWKSGRLFERLRCKLHKFARECNRCRVFQHRDNMLPGEENSSQFSVTMFSQ